MVFGAIVLLLLTVLSPVYAGFTFSESTSIKSKTVETTKIENRNLLDRKSFLDRYDPSERNENHHFNHPRNHPLRKSTLVDGEEWDIIVPDDYSTIQEAVNAADVGYQIRIFVRAGIYKENIKIYIWSLTLHGENKRSTIIDGSMLDYVILLSEYSVLVNCSGYTIKNGVQEYSGMNIASDYKIIEANIITHNDNGIQ